MGPNRAVSPHESRPRPVRPPRGHWLVVGLLLVVFTLGLAVEGYTHGVLGESAAGIAQAAVGGAAAPAAVLHGGPVINAVGRGCAATGCPAGPSRSPSTTAPTRSGPRASSPSSAATGCPPRSSWWGCMPQAIPGSSARN